MKKNFLFCFFFLLTTLLSAQNKNVFRISKIDSTERIELNKFWKFHNGDDSSWVSASFDDSKWDTVNTSLKFDKNDSCVFKGIAWLRLHIYIDSSLNNDPLCILMSQEGASQIFIDGKLIHSFGTISIKAGLGKKYNPNKTPFSFPYHKAGEHILAVRYCNLNYRQLFEKYNTNDPGFEIQIAKQDPTAEHLFVENTVDTALLVGMALFFFTLGFIHLLFFLFYKKQRTNLYYSVFVLLLGLLFFIPELESTSFDPEFSIKIFYSYTYILPVFFYSMLILEYSLFKRKTGIYFWISTVALIPIIILQLYVNTTFSDITLLSFIISTVVASFFIVIKSILKKSDGAWIIGTGSLSFLLLLGIILIRILFFGGNFYVNNIFLVVLIFLAVISIPVSMSIYLARDFARTSNNLGKKLIEVETLSEKTIEQEKEKQKILETQNEVLEIQVKERTSEIVKQKTIIEDKNRDITDSINYAKTIQEVILPSKELKQQLFPNSFVLFKPKDIVSGDFYWYTEKNGKKIIAACDCTGHGVPGALMSMIGNNMLNQIVNEHGITAPDEILNSLHKEIYKALKQEAQNETKDGMDIALIAFNNETEIEFAGAQRPIWIIKNQESSSLIEIKGDRIAIGGLQMENERKFVKHTIALTKGDCVYIFSDGFADQFSSDNKKLMSYKFKELVINMQQESMPNQELFLNNFIEDWKGTREQIDDILVIGIRI